MPVAEDYEALRQEAALVIEYLRTVKPGPETLAMIERAQELQRLGWEARELVAATAEKEPS